MRASILILILLASCGPVMPVAPSCEKLDRCWPQCSGEVWNEFTSDDVCQSHVLIAIQQCAKGGDRECFTCAGGRKVCPDCACLEQ